MTRIYLIRHAEAEGNLYRIAQGQYDSNITEKGRRQIDALAERFRNERIDALYSSDLRRALSTAGAITRYHALEVRTDKRLREIDIGEYEGMSFGNMQKLDPAKFELFYKDPAHWHAKGAESFEEYTERFYTAVKEIAESNRGSTVAVASHGLVIRAFMAKISGIPSSEISTLPRSDNTAVTLLEYENGEFSVLYHNDNSHLTQELAGGSAPVINISYEPLNPYEKPDTYICFYEQSWLAAHGNLDRFVPSFFLQSAQRRFDRDSEAVMGVYLGDKLIGILELDDDKGRHLGYGWISLICLEKEYRGRGLGIQPLGYAITRYQRMGRGALRLYVSSENKHALGFYEHCGFKILNVEAGAGAPLYLMEKKLR